jgi:hypothetical protein
LLDPLGEQDQLDLFAFLGRLGKPGDFDASQGGVARRWQLAQTFHTDGQAGQDLWPVTARADDKRWQPTTALVKGTLTRALIGQALRAEGWSSRLGVFAATEVTVARAGKIRFKLAAGPGTELWVGGKRVGGEGESTTELPVGTHRIVVKLDPKQMPGSVRLASDDVAAMCAVYPLGGRTPGGRMPRGAVGSGCSVVGAAALAPGAAAGKGKKVETVASGGKTLFRTSVTGFASRADADAFCSRLKAARKDCFVR